MLTIEKRRRWIFLVGLLLVFLALSSVVPHIVKFLEVYGAAVTAAATAFIAWFTWTLKRSTDRLWQASNNQLDLSKENTCWQLRAYLGITGAPIVEGDDHWIVAVDYWNKGQTPAHDVRSSFSVQLLNSDPNPEFPPADDWPGSWVIVPTAHATPDRRVNISAAQREAMTIGTEAIYAWGHIAYRDVFDGRVHVTFRYRVRRSAAGKWQLHPEAEGNDTEYFPPPKNAGLSEPT